jgi:hypothetical protein
MGRQKMRLLVLSAGLLFAPLSVAASWVGAEDLAGTGFWQKNVGLDWSERPVENSSATIRFADGPVQKKAKGAEKRKAKSSELSATQQPSTAQPQTQNPDESLTDAQAIIRRFGDPTKDREMLPEGDAPPEFMGIAAAMNAGDKDLAFKYARSFVRRLRKQRDFVATVTEVQDLASRAEGFLPPRESESKPLTAVEEEYIDAYREGMAERIAAEKMSPEVIGLLEEASQSESVPLEFDPRSVPRDSKGAVSVLFFISASDDRTAEFAKRAHQIMVELVDDKRLEFSVATKESLPFVERNELGKQLGLAVPVINGAKLAQRFRINDYPAIVFYGRTEGRIFRLFGVESVRSAERVVGLMQGGGK